MSIKMSIVQQTNSSVAVLSGQLLDNRSVGLAVEYESIGTQFQLCNWLIIIGDRIT